MHPSFNFQPSAQLDLCYDWNASKLVIDTQKLTGGGRYSRSTTDPLDFDEPSPSYEACLQNGRNSEPWSLSAATERQEGLPETIIKSARYPRVAVLLGVHQQYYLPLLVCRSLSTIFAIVWAAQACYSIYALFTRDETRVQKRDTLIVSPLVYRLCITQIALSFLWV